MIVRLISMFLQNTPPFHIGIVILSHTRKHIIQTMDELLLLLIILEVKYVSFVMCVTCHLSKQ